MDLKSIPMEDRVMFILHIQCHGCWWPGNTRYWHSSPGIFLFSAPGGSWLIISLIAWWWLPVKCQVISFSSHLVLYSSSASKFIIIRNSIDLFSTLRLLKCKSIPSQSCSPLISTRSCWCRAACKGSILAASFGLYPDHLASGMHAGGTCVVGMHGLITLMRFHSQFKYYTNLFSFNSMIFFYFLYFRIWSWDCNKILYMAWYVQNFVVITLLEFRWKQNFQGILIVSEMGHRKTTIWCTYSYSNRLLLESLTLFLLDFPELNHANHFGSYQFSNICLTNSSKVTTVHDDILQQLMTCEWIS